MSAFFHGLFLLLFFAVLIILIVGLRKPERIKQPTRKRVWIVYGGAMIVVLLLIGITSPSSGQVATTPTQTTSAAQPAAPQTLDQRIAVYAPQVYGNGIAFNKIEKQDDGSVLITLDVSDIIGKSTFRTKTGTLSARIFQDTFAEYPKAPEVSVIYAGEKVDMYGKKSNGTLMSYFITKPTFAKFDWSNFQTFTLCDILQKTGLTEDGAADFTDGCAIFATDLR